MLAITPIRSNSNINNYRNNKDIKLNSQPLEDKVSFKGFNKAEEAFIKEFLGPCKTFINDVGYFVRSLPQYRRTDLFNGKKFRIKGGDDRYRFTGNIMIPDECLKDTQTYYSISDSTFVGGMQIQRIANVMPNGEIKSVSYSVNSGKKNGMNASIVYKKDYDGNMVYQLENGDHYEEIPHANFNSGLRSVNGFKFCLLQF